MIFTIYYESITRELQMLLLKNSDYLTMNAIDSVLSGRLAHSTRSRRCNFAP